ncbi:putative ferric-chelate reductase 1 homolog [Daphnia carinata]|uniref:putative ferric-chelate reductase 1 homolog n=1 Tax=Daphnia carinata TaxID=120202 RepID=UPI00257AF7C0|nr:putative ferric-chelate reductase 1 homolog [Daphnia carinata]
MISFRSLRTSSCLIFVTLIGTLVSGTPNGAPVAACSTMTPEHGVEAKTTRSPYVTIPTLMEDESVRLTLMANSSGYSTFRGYLVMAFDNSLGDAAPPIGIFSETVEGTPVLTPGNYLDCLNGVKNAATHKDNAPKVIVNLLWVPPYGFMGDVVFKTTYVQNVTSFWVKTLSDVVSISSPTTTTTPASTNTTPAGATKLTPWIGTIVLAVVAIFVTALA